MKCECRDPGCKVHPGFETANPCERKATDTLYRIDMEDRTGTRFCKACALDAYESGLFSGEPTRDPDEGWNWGEDEGLATKI